ncbi:MAG: transposase [Lentimonas sp.]
MLLPQRKYLPHDVPPWVEDGAVYFITINCSKRGTNQLCRTPIAEELRASIQFRQQKLEWWVPLVLLMPDHLHALISFSGAVRMKDSISNWKRFTARKHGISWQDGFFDHRIRDVNSLVEKEQYIRMNPIRQGLCNTPEEWAHTWSAKDFEGKDNR